MTDEQIWSVVQAFPEGYCEVHYLQRRYSVTAHTFAGGRSRKVLARQLGGSDFISFNCYHTDNGLRLKPCEMPRERVIDFLETAQVA